MPAACSTSNRTHFWLWTDLGNSSPARPPATICSPHVPAAGQPLPQPLPQEGATQMNRRDRRRAFPTRPGRGHARRLEALEEAGQGAIEFLGRHAVGDWGEVDAEDAKENDLSLQEGFRILSAIGRARVSESGSLPRRIGRRRRSCCRMNTDSLTWAKTGSGGICGNKAQNHARSHSGMAEEGTPGKPAVRPAGLLPGSRCLPLVQGQESRLLALQRHRAVLQRSDSVIGCGL